MTISEAGEKIRSYMDKGCATSIRTLVKDYSSRMALGNLESGHLNGRGGETKREIEKLALNFSRKVAGLMKCSGTKYRHVTLDLNLYLLLRDTLKIRADRFLAILIDKYAPEKQSSTHGAKFYADQFTPAEEELIRSDLTYRRIPEREIDDAFFDIVVTADARLQAMQLVLIARPRIGDRNDGTFDGGFSRTILDLIKNMDFDLEKAAQFYRETADEFRADPEEFINKRWDDPVESKIPGWVVTSGGDWDQMLVQLRERLPLALQSDPWQLPHEKPSQLEWLCEEADQFLICWGEFQIGQPKPFLEYQLRRFSAVCECLLGTGDTREDEFAVFEESGVGVRILTIPLQLCRAEGRQPFAGTKLIDYGWGELTLPRWPIQSVEALNELEARGLRQVLEWLYTDEATHIGRALDAFEAARSIGGANGFLTPDEEQGWRLSALCSCLEKLFETRNVSRDWKRDKIEEAVRALLGDNKAALVGPAFDRRNDHVHDNEFKIWDNFSQFYAMVRGVLGLKLQKLANVCS